MIALCTVRSLVRPVVTVCHRPERLRVVVEVLNVVVVEVLLVLVLVVD